MSIVIRSGFLAAVASVQTYLTASGVLATCEVGWKRRTRQSNQSEGGGNRVVFIPSDASGKGGKLVPPRYVGPRGIRDPLAIDPTRVVADVRALLDWERSATVSVWAVDATARENEPAQIEAVETLFEWVVRGVHIAPGAFGSVSWGETQWTPPIERSFGLEMQATFTYHHPIFDTPRDVVYPTSGAVSRAAYVPPSDSSSSGDT